MKIEPVTTIERPLWSVMIPTFNCARFLGRTLRTVLDQDFSDQEMEIVVVDDVSTQDDPKEVTQRIGQRRVRFEQNPQNLGAIKNFNRCIALSRGHYVHILHGDDFVDDGFYNAIESLFSSACAFAATRTIAVDEHGIPEWISPRVRSLETPSNDVSEIVMGQKFQTPSVVVKRSFYEEHGGFDEELPHCADWEMWVRAVSKGGGVVHPYPFARYRMFAGNDTSRLAKTGENIRDRLRLVPRFEGLPGFNRKHFTWECGQMALAQGRHFQALNDGESAANNLYLYRDIVGMV